MRYVKHWLKSLKNQNKFKKFKKFKKLSPQTTAKEI